MANIYDAILLKAAKAAEIREESWVSSENPYGCKYTKTLGAAVDEVCSDKLENTIVYGMLKGAWSGTIGFIDRMEAA
jgi:hypothetical protein